MLLDAIQKASLDEPLHEVIHRKALEYLRIFLIIGGLLEVVATYIAKNDMLKCQKILDDLIITLRADFVKYKQRVPSLQISTVFNMVTE